MVLLLSPVLTDSRWLLKIELTVLRHAEQEREGSVSFFCGPSHLIFGGATHGPAWEYGRAAHARLEGSPIRGPGPVRVPAFEAVRASFAPLT
jgi:hypothetical protein